VFHSFGLANFGYGGLVVNCFSPATAATKKNNAHFKSGR